MHLLFNVDDALGIHQWTRRCGLTAILPGTEWYDALGHVELHLRLCVRLRLQGAEQLVFFLHSWLRKLPLLTHPSFKAESLSIILSFVGGSRPHNPAHRLILSVSYLQVIGLNTVKIQFRVLCETNRY